MTSRRFRLLLTVAAVILGGLCGQGLYPVLADVVGNARLGGGGGGAGTPGGADTQVQFNDGGAFGGDAGLVFNKTTNVLTAGSIVDSALTATRVTFAGASGLLSDDADLTFATDTLTATIGIGSTRLCAAGALDAANSVCASSNAITFEGSSADANELVLASGNHTADNNITLTGTSATLTFSTLLTQVYNFQTTDAGTSAVVEAQSTAVGGLGALRVKNDQGANAFALFAQFGSTHGSSLAGISTNNLAALQAGGSSLSALLLYTSTADPFIIGANDRSRYYIEDSARTLTDNTATALFTVTLGDDTHGGGTVSFCVFASSAATDGQKTCGEVNFAVLDVTAGAGGESCAAAVTGTNSTVASTGTLTVTADAATGTDLCTIRLTADSSLNVSPTAIYSVALQPSASTVVVNPS